jgi:exonuclease SbcC
MRPAKSGNGETREKSEAALKYPDGRITTGAKNVTKAIEELIGIDREQFTQIAMIAQGDFLKLLLASTNERSDIFRKIFNTRPYQVFEETLKSESAVLKAQYDDIVKSIIQYISGIVCGEDNVLYIELKKIKENKSVGAVADTIKLIEQLTAEDEAELKVNTVLLSKAEAAIDEINKVIGKAESDAMAKKDIKTAEEVLKTCEPELLELKAAYDKELAKAPEREQLAVEIDAGIKKLSSYDELDTLKQKKTVMEAALNKTAKRLQKANEDDNELTVKIAGS